MESVWHTKPVIGSVGASRATEVPAGRGTAPAIISATASAAAGTTALVAGNASGATTALSNRWYAAAPYLMPLDNDPPDPAAIMDATGLTAFQLAFVLAPNQVGQAPPHHSSYGRSAIVDPCTAPTAADLVDRGRTAAGRSAGVMPVAV